MQPSVQTSGTGDAMTLIWAGFLMGCAFGVTARLGRFCLIRGLREYHSGSEAPALKAFALAMAVAVLATQSLAWLGMVDLGNAQVVRAQFSIVGVLIGGILFGAGMALARSCGARALVLLAGGNLRALVTLLCLGLAAQATLTGVLAPVRQWLQGWGTVRLPHGTLPHWMQALGLSNGWSTLGITLVLALPLLFYALRRPTGRANGLALLCAAAIGALVAAGWWITASMNADAFEPVPLTSLSFVGPVAEGLLYLQLSVGRELSLGPAIVAGTFTGALAAALLSRSTRWEGFDSPKQITASALGGCLMGFGGVLAVGCSVGQGLSGFSTLAFASMPACTGIVVGALLTLKIQSIFIPGHMKAIADVART